MLVYVNSITDITLNAIKEMQAEYGSWLNTHIAKGAIQRINDLILEADEILTDCNEAITIEKVGRGATNTIEYKVNLYSRI